MLVRYDFACERLVRSYVSSRQQDPQRPLCEHCIVITHARVPVVDVSQEIAVELPLYVGANRCVRHRMQIDGWEPLCHQVSSETEAIGQRRSHRAEHVLHLLLGHIVTRATLLSELPKHCPSQHLLRSIKRARNLTQERLVEGRYLMLKLAHLRIDAFGRSLELLAHTQLRR